MFAPRAGGEASGGGGCCREGKPAACQPLCRSRHKCCAVRTPTCTAPHQTARTHARTQEARGSAADLREDEGSRRRVDDVCIGMRIDIRTDMGVERADVRTQTCACGRLWGMCRDMRSNGGSGASPMGRLAYTQVLRTRGRAAQGVRVGMLYRHACRHVV